MSDLEAPTRSEEGARRSRPAGALAVPSEGAGIAVLYTFLGSSRQLIVGPEGSIATLVAAAVLPLAAASSSEASELGSMLALLVAWMKPHVQVRLAAEGLR